MKFEYVSLCIMLKAMLLLSCAGHPKAAPAGNAKPKKAASVECRELQIKTDTIRFTNYNFKKCWPSAVVACFLSESNTIRMTYFDYDKNAKSYIKEQCDIRNMCLPVVFRHEMEHARNADLVYNTHGLSRWDNARIAVMDEVASAGAEIIESQNYRFEKGERFPYNRMFLHRADSMIMSYHDRTGGDRMKNIRVDFSDSAIADIVLRCAVDKFSRVCDYRFYKQRIRNRLKGINGLKYITGQQCDKSRALFLPEYGQWGGMFTYDVVNPFGKNCRVDIWNLASDETRKYVIKRVDEIIKSNTLPGEMLNRNLFQKNILKSKRYR